VLPAAAARADCAARQPTEEEIEMANYYAAARSNPFTVRDPDALKRDLADLQIHVQVSDEPPNQVTLFCHNEAGWPSSRYDEVTGEEIEVCVHEIVAPHLLDGHVAVFVEAGSEALRHVGGLAVAVNSTGETCRVDLEEIYERAANLGSSVLVA
jgi:hypothetical protein